MPLDINRLRTTTSYNRKHLDEWIDNAERAYTDADRKGREAHQRCRWCHYARAGRVALQAFTEWTCIVCDVAQPPHHNSNHPKVCVACACANNLCTECGGDFDMRDRRKVERKRAKGGDHG
jgi:hypothetical protein